MDYKLRMIGFVYLKAQTYRINNMIREREIQVREYFTTRTNDKSEKKKPYIVNRLGGRGNNTKMQPDV